MVPLPRSERPSRASRWVPTWLRSGWGAIPLAGTPRRADYPNALNLPEPVRTSFRPAGKLLTLLVVLSLLPRLLMALKVHALCPDGVFYIGLAEALERGDFRRALEEVNINVFPIILAALHRLGLDWELAGKLWGIGIASLVVLPLFGWARRQFDDRVAFVACLLYAFHGKFIVWSPELIRDPTFWFFFAFSLYSMWRAVTEVRLRLFAMAGMAVALAALSRFEGLFLLFPLLLWPLWRWFGLRCQRGRLALGVAVSLLIFPAFLLLVNLTLFRHLPEWEWFRVKPLALLHGWIAALIGQDPATIVPETLPIAARMALMRLNWKFLDYGQSGLTPVYALLMFGGVWAWRGIWTRRDHQPLFYTALAVAGGMWIHLWYVQGSCNRYILPVALMGSVFAALGLLSLADWLVRQGSRFRGMGPWQVQVATGLLGLSAVIGYTDAMASDYRSRNVQPYLGHWIEDSLGPTSSILGTEGLAPVVGHYAHCRAEAFPLYMNLEQIEDGVRSMQPDVLLLAITYREMRQGVHRYMPLLEHLQAVGYTQVPQENLPGGCPRILVVVKQSHLARLAPPQPALCWESQFGSLMISFLVSFALALVFTPAVRAIARRCAALDYPDGIRKLHPGPVPLWGGLSVYLAMACGLVAAGLGCVGTGPLLDYLFRVLVIVAAFVCLIGGLDDCFRLGPRVKLLLQIVAVSPMLLWGCWVDRVVVFGYPIDLGWLGGPLTICWLIGCINALNLLDGMDGLASLVGLSTAVMMGLIAATEGHPHVAVAAIVLAGALAGFLVYNLPPATIFLGDSGSMVVGLVVGLLGIQGGLKSSATLSITAPAVVMALPLLDIVLAIIRRKLTGRRMDAADREHIHHRLLERGFSPRQVLWVVGTLCLLTGAAAAAATLFRNDTLAWIATLTLVVLAIRLRLFGHYEFGLLKQAAASRVGRLAEWLAGAVPPTPVATETGLNGLWSELLRQTAPWQVDQWALLLDRDGRCPYSLLWSRSDLERSDGAAMTFVVSLTLQSRRCRLEARWSPAKAHAGDLNRLSHLMHQVAQQVLEQAAAETSPPPELARFPRGSSVPPLSREAA